MTATTVDRLLGGRVVLHQPATGYRAALDPVLLAAFVTAPQGGRVLDLGCGTGAAALCLAARRPDLALVGLDCDGRSLALARQSAAASGLADRVAWQEGAIEDWPERDAYAALLTNPPFQAAGTGTRPPDGHRAAAHVEVLPLAPWLDHAVKLLAPKGRLHVIHRADRLPELLALLRPRLGALTVLPLWPRAGAPARRVLVAGIKDSRAPARLLPGLVLHEAAGGYTGAAEAVLRDGAAIPS